MATKYGRAYFYPQIMGRLGVDGMGVGASFRGRTPLPVGVQTIRYSVLDNT
jgi:hypothetical protein